MRLSACLLSWRRKYHIPEICECLLDQYDFHEVIVYQNASDGSMPPLPDCVRVIHQEDNDYVMGRFRAAYMADSDAVFFQDDDLLVHNIQELVDIYLENEESKIIANLADDSNSRHWRVWQRQKNPWVELGFGSIAPRRFVDNTFDGWPHGEELLLRKADKVFSIMNPWQEVRADKTRITRLYHNGRESGRDKNSLWLRGDHKPLNNKIIRLCLEWKKEKLG